MTLVFPMTHLKGPLFGQYTSHCQLKSKNVYIILAITMARAIMKRGICFPVMYGTLVSKSHTSSCEPSEYWSVANDNEAMIVRRSFV